MDYKKFRQAKAIEASNKKKLLKVNPKLDEGTGIYILWRTETHGYIGQSVKLLTRLAQHMSGYDQHIDRSMKAHGLYSEENKGGYKIDFFHCPVLQLDEKEREYIQKAIDAGWIVKNKTGGGQDEGKEKIADYRPAKGYRDGIQQGKKSLARDLSHIIDTHLQISLKPENRTTKLQSKLSKNSKKCLMKGTMRNDYT